MPREHWKGHCWHCATALAAADYERANRCPGCSRATHACRNCRFYQPGLANDCREPVADFVNDKERANFCDYFEPAEDPTGANGGQDAEELLQAAQDLFD